MATMFDCKEVAIGKVLKNNRDDKAVRDRVVNDGFGDGDSMNQAKVTQ
jgi:hypothetical protein